MSDQNNHSLSLANPDIPGLNLRQKIALGLGLTGLLIMVLALFNTPVYEK
ncbi:MAG: hypothetical protein HKO94_02380, partial [Flavobacteriaceae bacterium]|nr:hypothetical protein [Flavobacteriaceae bacterium]